MNPSSRAESQDRIWGVGIVAVSILSVGGGLGATGLGGAPGFVGRLASLIGIGAQTTERAALLGGAIALLSAIRIVGGFGIARGRRWGLVLTAISTVLSLPLNVGHLPHGTAKAGLILNPAVLCYCCLRLSKRTDKAPL